MSRSPLRPALPARRRTALIALSSGVAIALAGCSAGQITQTSVQRSGVDGVEYQQGDIKIVDAAIEAPSSSGWDTGETAAVHMAITNASLSDDEITSIEIDGVPVTLAAAEDSEDSSESAAAPSATDTTASAPEAVESGPLLIPGEGLVMISDDGDAQASFEVPEGPLYTSESLPIVITFATAGEVSFDIIVGSSLEEQDIDPSETFNLHEEAGGGGH